MFAARAGVHATEGGLQLGSAARADVIDAVQTVFVIAAPLAALALIAVLSLPEAPLRTRHGAPETSQAANPSGHVPRVSVGTSR